MAGASKITSWVLLSSIRAVLLMLIIQMFLYFLILAQDLHSKQKNGESSEEDSPNHGSYFTGTVTLIPALNFTS